MLKGDETTSCCKNCVPPRLRRRHPTVVLSWICVFRHRHGALCRVALCDACILLFSHTFVCSNLALSNPMVSFPRGAGVEKKEDDEHVDIVVIRDDAATDDEEEASMTGMMHEAC